MQFLNLRGPWGAAESAGKNGPKIAPKSIQDGANLAQRIGKGYPKTNNNMKTQLTARNTYRGMKKEETIESKNTQRSIKRNSARRNKRTQTQSNSTDKVTGRPKGHRNHDNRHSISPKCENGQNIRNTQGLKRIEKRPLIENYVAKW